MYPFPVNRRDPYSVTAGASMQARACPASRASVLRAKAASAKFRVLFTAARACAETDGFRVVASRTQGRRSRRAGMCAATCRCSSAGLTLLQVQRRLQ